MTGGYLAYSSSLDAKLKLFATFVPTPGRSPVMLDMHGWHGSGKGEHTDNLRAAEGAEFVTVLPDMRGRADSGGHADCNGWELQDAVDAIGAAAALFKDAVDAQATPRLHGGSGGGGNTLGLLGKFPDLFSAAVCLCGISDYGLWFAHDRVGEFRDEMEGKSWVGGTPGTHPEGYLSRGGRTTAMNLLTPLLLFHGEADPRCPIEQAQVYEQAVRAHGRESLLRCVYWPGVGKPGHFSNLSKELAAERDRLKAAHLREHTAAPILPESGRMVVAGYLVTRRFEMRLESASQVALLDYDLKRGSWRVAAPSCRTAKVRLAGEAEWRSVRCDPMSLEGFCRSVGVPHPGTLA